MKKNGIREVLKRLVKGAYGLLIVSGVAWVMSILVAGFAYLVMWLMGGTVDFSLDMAARAGLWVVGVVLFVVESYLLGVALETSEPSA